MRRTVLGGCPVIYYKELSRNQCYMDTPASWIRRLEAFLIAVGILFFKSVFFFLSAPQQSLMVSFFHYAIFFVGLYFFMYRAKPNGIYRPLFFVFVLVSLLCYLMFNKCLLTHMELGICNETNVIQRTVESFFGSRIEGNHSSKVVLGMLTIVTGLFLMNDYANQSKK
jgi:hypothetical protein